MKKTIRQTQGKHFYSHLVETSFISLELGDMDLTSEERLSLISLVDSQLHHLIMDTILSELSEEDKKTFLNHLSQNDHEKIWKHLSEKVENIEIKIKKAVLDLKKELHKEIEEAKKK